MTNFEMNEGQVMIFKNGKKTEEKHPDYKGEIMVNGDVMDIALWVKEGNKGKYFSGKISKKLEHKKEANSLKSPQSDDLPF